MRRWTVFGAGTVLLAAGLPLVLLAISAAAPPDGKGRPAGPPAAVKLAPSSLDVACDGAQFGTLSVHLTDSRRKPISDGTEVAFDVRQGYADPVEAHTVRGDASTKIRLYPSAAGADPEPVVRVLAGDIDASIHIGCSGGASAPSQRTGRPAGSAAAIELFPSPLHVACDGRQTSTLVVRLADARGRPVADGTEVSFSATDGTVDPAQTATRHGEAVSQVGSAASGLPDFEVFVRSGDLLASIKVKCDQGGGSCATSPPQHAVSPPCATLTPPPTPCGGSSPPCATPCAGAASPPCVTPVPCGAEPISPPCVTGTPTVTATPTGTQTRYVLGLFGQTQLNDTVTLSAYILDQGGGPYSEAVWNLDYDEQNVSLLSAEKTSPAPTACDLTADNGSRVLLGCARDPGQPPLDYYGDAWMLTFQCLRDGVFDYRLLAPDPSLAPPTHVLDAASTEQPISTIETQVGCGQSISTPAPTETPTGAAPTPCSGACAATATPTPLFQLGVDASETSPGVIQVDLFIRDTGGGSYEAAQWNLDYPEGLVGVATFAPAAGAPAACNATDDDGSRLLATCDFPGDTNGLSQYGTIFVATFVCLQSGSAQIEPSVSSFVRMSGAPVNIVTLPSTIICSQASTPTPG